MVLPAYDYVYDIFPGSGTRALAAEGDCGARHEFFCNLFSRWFLALEFRHKAAWRFVEHAGRRPTS